MRSILLLSLAAFTSTALALPCTARGQVTELTPADHAVFAMEVTKPFFSEGDFGFATSTILGRALVPVADRVWFQGDLGLSFASVEGESGATLSNATLGVVLASASGWPLGRFAISLPTSHDFSGEGLARFTGLYTDPDQWERFSDDTWSVHGLLTPGTRIEGGSMGFRVGGSAHFPEGGGDPEFAGRYGVYAVREFSRVRVGADLSGQAWLSESGLSFSERSWHQLTASVGLVRAAASPDVYVRIPLDEDYDEAIMLGIRVTF